MPRDVWSSRVFLLAGLLVVGCSSEPLPGVACLTNFDCAPSEACFDGVCLTYEAPIIGMDASTSPVDPDSGHGLDAGPLRAPDGGVVATEDSGVVAPPDSGVPPCAAPIVVGSGQYCDIPAALAAATPRATLSIPEGTYAGGFTIDKPITLQGVGSVIITGTEAVALTIAAEDVGLRGITIDAASRPGVLVSAPRAALVDVNIRNAKGSAISIPTAGASASFLRVTIGAVAVDGVDGHGLMIGVGASAEVTGSRIEDSAFSGVVVEGTLTLDSSTILRAGRTGCTALNTAACRPGIWVRAGTAVIRNGSAINGSGSSGVYVEAGSLRMTGSDASDNGTTTPRLGDGITIDGPGASATLEGNSINRNQRYGVRCVDDDADVCRNNDHDDNRSGWSNCNEC